MSDPLVLKSAIAGAIAVGVVDASVAMVTDELSRRQGPDLAGAVALILLGTGAALGACEWIVLRGAALVERPTAKGLIHAAGISAAPSALGIALAVERWSAIGWAARALLVASLVAWQALAFALAKGLAAWREGAGSRSVGFRVGAVGLALAALVLLHAADRLVLPRLYARLHDALALASLGAGQLLALAARDLVPAGLRKRYGRPIWASVLLLSVVPGALALARLERDRALGFALLERTAVAGRVLALGRRALDVDGDGHARALGGGDCNDRAAAIHPSALDLPENGIDEDCSGSDLRLEEIELAPPAPAPPVQHRFDVLLVTIDALRADHLGAYGYARPTTPNLDRLALRSIVFERAYAPSNSTSASMPALVVGRYPSTSPWSFDHPARVGDGWPYLTDEPNVTLAELLRGAGYRTALLGKGGPLRELGLAQGFDTVRWRVAEQADELPSFVGARPEKPWFAWIHYDEPHAPYDARPEHDFGASDVDRYDSEIAFVDARVGRILEWLAGAGRTASTIVVVTADHGEEFREHGGVQHASTLYEEQIRVPLLLHVPGVAPARVARPVELVGVVPTVLAVLGVEPPPALDGRSLLAPASDPAPQRAYVEQYNGSILRRALVTDRFKLIENVTWNTRELYDLALDPHERSNRVSDEPELLGRLQHELATLTERRLLHTLAVARRQGGPALDALARLLPVIERPELFSECAAILADAAARDTQVRAGERWVSDLALAARRADLPLELRRGLVPSLERLGGAWALRGLIWLSAVDAPGTISPASAALERASRSGPPPFKWPARAETAPEVHHVDFGTRHGDWHVMSGTGRVDLSGARTTAWSSGELTRVAFFLDPAGVRAGDWFLEAAGWAHPDAGARLEVEVRVGGARAGSLVLEQRFTQKSLVVPSSLLRPGLNIVDLVYPRTFGTARAAARWDFAMLFPKWPSAFDVLVGSTASAIEFRAGWDRIELWRGVMLRPTQGERATLVIPLDPAARPYRLLLELAAAAPPVAVSASVNGRSVGRVQVAESWQLHELEVPREALVAGPNHVELSIHGPDGGSGAVVRVHAVNLAPR